MKVLVTGYNGQLGYDVVRVLKEKNIECLGVDIEKFDLTKKSEVSSFLSEYNPTVVVHCAAYTQVDNAEDNQELAYDVNVNGTKYIVDYCKANNVKLCFFSTDYVFDGQGDTFYDTSQKKEPLNYYGYTKKEAEDYITETIEKYFIIRISWVFGINGNNFVKTMLSLAETRDELSVVCDQVGSPTYTLDLADFVYNMVSSEKYGVYHATNEGICSWSEFADEIFKLADKKVIVKGILTSEYPTKAKRPFNSRLSKQSLVDIGFNLLPNWQDALKRYIEELQVNGDL